MQIKNKIAVKKTSVSLRPELIVAAQRRLLDLEKKTSVSSAIVRALEHWVSDPSVLNKRTDSNTKTKAQLKEPDKSGKNELSAFKPGMTGQLLHSLLSEVLESGNEVAIGAIQQNLAAFALLVRQNVGNPSPVPADIAAIVDAAHRIGERDQEVAARTRPPGHRAS